MIIYENMWEISTGIKKYLYQSILLTSNVTRAFFKFFKFWCCSAHMVNDILYLLYFLLALLNQMHIIEQSSVYIVRFGSDRWQLFLNLMLGAFTGRLLKDGVWWRWRMAIEPNLMFLNIIMSTVMVLILGTYQRQFIWIFIFSMGANMSNIWCHFVFREYWFCVCGLCQHFLYRVQGHVHITLQSMCNVWIDEMWNMVGIKILLLFFFFFAPKNPASQWDPEDARQIVLTHGLLWLRRL